MNTTDMRGILMWVGFLAIFAAGMLFSGRLKKQIEENGIETVGTISRVVDDESREGITTYVYARYRNRDGEEVEGVLTNGPSNLFPGQKVHLKYHPRHQMNARLIEVLHE
jgi:urease gamma subunit